MLTVNESEIDKITEAFYLILKGKKPAPINLPEDYPDNEIKQAVGYINRFIDEYNRSIDWVQILSRGDLSVEAPMGNLLILQSLKTPAGEFEAFDLGDPANRYGRLPP